jgi:hypothetical protein
MELGDETALSSRAYYKNEDWIILLCLCGRLDVIIFKQTNASLWTLVQI